MRIMVEYLVIIFRKRKWLKYLQDVHVENYANRGKSAGMLVLRALVIVLAVGCLVLGLLIPPFIFGTIGFGLLAWFLGTRLELDFDYSYTNGTIDIAKVFTKSSRKKYLSFEMKDVVVVAPVGTDPVRGYEGRGLKVLDCSSRNPQIKTYEVVYHDPKSSNNGVTVVLMDLEDDFLEAMRTVSPSAVHKD